MFSVTSRPIDLGIDEMTPPIQSGAQVIFSGHVRNRNDGKEVLSLDYEAYPEMAELEGNAILCEAHERFAIHEAVAIHRTGSLKLGEMAIWIRVRAAHRDDAFLACRYIIDTIKARVPIWKKEYYLDEEPVWVRCHHHEC